jgi:hypothetical protein
MKRTIIVLLTSIVLLASFAIPVLAHHAFAAEYDVARPLTLKGKVTKWELVNPHSWIHIDVTGPDGKVTPWMVEGGSPNSLLRNGFTKNSLPAGTEIVVEGYQAKDGANRAVGKDITYTDGKRLFLGGSAPGAGGGGENQ